MARCEGSPRYRAPGVDLLECRFLLSPLRGNAKVSHTTLTVAAEVSHQAVATADKDAAEKSRVAANSLHNLSPVDDDIGIVIEDEVSAIPEAAVVRPNQTDLNLLFSESPHQADNAIEEPTSGLETSLVISPETTHLAPMVYPGPSIAVGVEDQFDRGMIVAPSDPQRILPGITTESLERLDALMSVDPGLGAKAEAAPRRSDLLSDFLPFDRRSLEDAFDQFFDQLEDLGDGVPAPRDSTHTIPDSLILAAAIGALELGRRYWRRRRVSGEAGRDETTEGADDGDGRYSGWPGHWSTRFT